MPQCHLGIYILGVVAVAYLFSCLIYVMATRFMGRPFHDSLTDRQKAIKKESSRKRGAIFWISFVICLIISACCAYYFKS